MTDLGEDSFSCDRVEDVGEVHCEEQFITASVGACVLAHSVNGRLVAEGSTHAKLGGHYERCAQVSGDESSSEAAIGTSYSD